MYLGSGHYEICKPYSQLHFVENGNGMLKIRRKKLIWTTLENISFPRPEEEQEESMFFPRNQNGDIAAGSSANQVGSSGSGMRCEKEGLRKITGIDSTNIIKHASKVGH